MRTALGSLNRETSIPPRRNGETVSSEESTPLQASGGTGNDEAKRQADEREKLRKSLGVSRLENTFETFKVLPGTAEVLRVFKQLAESDFQRPFLLCYGGVGNGKTHLCEATVMALYQRGIFCRYSTMARVMRNLKAAMRSDSEVSSAVLLERYCQARCLVLDDVGMGGSGSEWEYGQLEEIVNERYHERLMTIITTNRDLGELPERVISRFSDPAVGIVVLNSGADYRRRKA
ncbi:ATP-binding protein [Chloroflexota bacterium]